MTLKATPQQQAIAARQNTTGAYGGGVVRPFKEKAKRFLRSREARVDNSPTPERRAKEQNLVKRGRVVGLKEDVADRHYRSAPPAETYAGKFKPETEWAFARYVYEASICDQYQYGSRITMNYDATGGGSPHNRMGGLGHVPSAVREIYECHQQIRRRLNLDTTAVLDFLVLGVRNEASGKVLSFADVGRVLFPWIKDKATGKGIGIGALVMAGNELAVLYHWWDEQKRMRKRDRHA